MAISGCTRTLSMVSNENATLIVFKMLSLVWGVNMVEMSSKNTEKDEWMQNKWRKNWEKTLMYYIFQTHTNLIREDVRCQGDLTFKVPLLSAWLWDQRARGFNPESPFSDCHFLGPTIIRTYSCLRKKADSIM